MSHISGLTVKDFFCGAGGSSTGMKHAGASLWLASNHEPVCIESHAANHPEADHECTDITKVKRLKTHYRKTDVMWASPECTSHSGAKKKKTKMEGLYETDLWGERQIDPDEERSRMTMFELYRIAEALRDPVIIMENVTDIKRWPKYPAFIHEMQTLGYEYRELFLNSRFFGVPQSRDRIYVVFWLKGRRTPDLDFRPEGRCEHCDRHVEARQSWKKNARGYRYGSSYAYSCPHCGAEVIPPSVPAASIIDWSLPIERIGDRGIINKKKPLAEKTRRRIEAGLRKFARPMVIDSAHTSSGDQVYSADGPIPTQTTKQTLYLSIPPYIVEANHGDASKISDSHRRVHSLAGQMPTLTGKGSMYLTVPPFITSYYGRESANDDLTDVLPTLTTSNRHWLTMLPFTMSINHSTDRNRGIDEPMPTVMPQARPGLVAAPFIMEYRNAPDGSVRSPGDPLTTITVVNHHALVMSYYNNGSVKNPDVDPLSALTTKHRHALVEYDWAGLVDDCLYRLLEPFELKQAQSFPADYILKGSKAWQVKQVGNAVSCNVAEWIFSRVAETFR